MNNKSNCVVIDTNVLEHLLNPNVSTPTPSGTGNLQKKACRGTVSLPFNLDKNGRTAVKITDDRGVERLTVVEAK